MVTLYCGSSQLSVLPVAYKRRFKLRTLKLDAIRVRGAVGSRVQVMECTHLMVRNRLRDIAAIHFRFQPLKSQYPRAGYLAGRSDCCLHQSFGPLLAGRSLYGEDLTPGIL